MNNKDDERINPQRLAAGFFRKEWKDLSELERRVARAVVERRNISRDLGKAFIDERTFGESVADKVASFGGSWTFILIFGGVILTWVFVNSMILFRYGDAFDPYPYILLNLFLSMLAAIQAPIIMMSQNRQAAKDRQDAAHDYEVNLKAEMEILTLHQKLDDLREEKWSELIQIQQKQLGLLEKILREHFRR